VGRGASRCNRGTLGGRSSGMRQKLPPDSGSVRAAAIHFARSMQSRMHSAAAVAPSATAHSAVTPHQGPASAKAFGSVK